jgi:Tfp pilus assembly protein PilX
MCRKAVDRKGESGMAIIVALAFLVVLMIMTSAFVSNLIASSNFESALEAKTKSFYIAEAGLNHAVWKLETQGSEYQGESGISFKDGNFDIAIEAHPDDPARSIVISCARLDGYPDARTESEVRAVVSGGDLKIESWEKVR